MATDPLEAMFLWPDPEKGPWFVEVWSRVQHGVPTPVGLRILGWNPTDSLDDPSGAELSKARALAALPRAEDPVPFPRLTSSVLRSLPIGQLFNEAHDALASALHDLVIPDELTARWSAAGQEEASAWNDEIRKEAQGFGGPTGGRDLGDDHYREVARIYSEAVKAGQSPTAAVAAHFAVSKSAAAKKVARARDRQFLPSTTRGRVGPLTEDL